jgi:hypothetical protein
MRAIKFVLWERYRAWWGAFQLNQKDPQLLARIKATEAPKEGGGLKTGSRRKGATKLQKQSGSEGSKKTRTKKKDIDPAVLEEFQRLAVGRGPEIKALDK